MVMWHIAKIQGLTDAEASEECDPETSRPTRVYLKDLDTGAVADVEFCMPLNVPVCEILNVLTETYAPNDWDAECGE